MKFEIGDRVRNLVNPQFSNGAEICTIHHFTSGWAYLTETGKRIRLDQIELAGGVNYEDEEL